MIPPGDLAVLAYVGTAYSSTPDGQGEGRGWGRGSPPAPPPPRAAAAGRGGGPRRPARAAARAPAGGAGTVTCVPWQRHVGARSHSRISPTGVGAVAGGGMREPLLTPVIRSRPRMRRFAPRGAFDGNRARPQLTSRRQRHNRRGCLPARIAVVLRRPRWRYRC